MSRRRTAKGPFAQLPKSPIFWLKCGILILIAVFLAFQATKHAVANVAWQQNPDLALRFNPDHAFALSLNADLLFADSQTPATLEKVETLARQSLKVEPLNAVALRLLGYVADIRGDRAKAFEFLSQAQKVSRRDFGTQLWLIEDAVAREDKVQALYHYDVAMRTSWRSHEILFPTLTGALADPDVRRGLTPYIKRRPTWLSAFMAQAIETSENPAYVADILMKSNGLPDTDSNHVLSNALLEKLLAKSSFSAYRQYYQSLPAAKNESLQQVGMNQNTVNLRYPAAGWRIAPNSAIGGTFSPVGKTGAYQLSAFAGSGERGEIMRKTVFLKPGNYRFSAVHHGSADVPDAQVIWELQCLSDQPSATLWNMLSPVKNGRFASLQDFTISSDCAGQQLVLSAAGGNSQQGVDFTLRDVKMTRR